MKKKIKKEYVPPSLSASDRKKQIKSIKDKTERPKVKFESKRSSWVEKFELKFGYKINQKAKIAKEIISKEGIDQILSKGKGAYYSAGSRPNQTATSWSLARLASVILGGPARRIDKKIWEKYKIKKK